MYGEPSKREFTVAKLDAYNNINSYLAELQGTTMKTVEDIVAYVDANSGTEDAREGDHAACASGQDLFNEVVAHRGVKDETYRKALSYSRRKSREEGIDAALHVMKDGQSIELDTLPSCDWKGAGQQIAARAVFVQVESGSLSDDIANLKIPRETVLKIAQRLDQHLAQHSAAAEQQKKPHPEPDTANPFKVRRGEIFNLKLKDFGDVHKSKWSQIDNPKLIIQLSNGTDEGAYPFIARDVGMTKVKLMVAHKMTLAVAFKEVEVVVVNG